MNDILKCVCPDCICPCEICPCVPMCRHKTIWQLEKECILFKRYYPAPYFTYKKMKLMEILNPTNWDEPNE